MSLHPPPDFLAGRPSEPPPSKQSKAKQNSKAKAEQLSSAKQPRGRWTREPTTARQPHASHPRNPWCMCSSVYGCSFVGALIEMRDWSRVMQAQGSKQVCGKAVANIKHVLHVRCCSQQFMAWHRTATAGQCNSGPCLAVRVPTARLKTRYKNIDIVREGRNGGKRVPLGWRD